MVWNVEDGEGKSSGGGGGGGVVIELADFRLWM